MRRTPSASSASRVFVRRRAAAAVRPLLPHRVHRPVARAAKRPGAHRAGVLAALTGGFAPTEYDRIAFGPARRRTAPKSTPRSARAVDGGLPRADHLARLQVHFVQELDDCDDDVRADDLRREQFLYQLRLLRGLDDFFWYFYLEEGTLGACAWGFVGLGHVFGGVRRRVCASWFDGS